MCYSRPRHALFDGFLQLGLLSSVSAFPNLPFLSQSPAFCLCAFGSFVSVHSPASFWDRLSFSFSLLLSSTCALLVRVTSRSLDSTIAYRIDLVSHTVLRAVVDSVDPANLPQYSLFLSHRVNNNHHAHEQENRPPEAMGWRANGRRSEDLPVG